MTAGDLVEYLLFMGDDALVAAQQLARWCTRAPQLEEDVALANIALDQLGAARLLLSYAGELEGAGRDEDALAYLRDDRQFRNCLLVELPDDDFAVAMVKLLFLSAYQRSLYDRLVGSTDQRLAGIAAKARKESAYHLDHASMWVRRLGDGTAESHGRTRVAVERLWPYTHELFAADPLAERLETAGVAVNPGALRDQWWETVAPVLADATVEPPADGWAPTGGRRGRHTEHLSYLLAEMQVVHRAHPGARW